MRGFAQYRCQRCDGLFQKQPGPTVCLFCKHPYLVWVNVFEMIGARFGLDRS